MQSYMMTYGGYCDTGTRTELINAAIVWYGSDKQNYQARVEMGYWKNAVLNPAVNGAQWYTTAGWTARDFIDKGFLTLEAYPTNNEGLVNNGLIADVDYVLINVGTGNTLPKTVSLQVKDVSYNTADENYVGAALKAAILAMFNVFSESTWMIKSAVVEMHNKVTKGV